MTAREYPRHPLVGVGALVVKDGRVLLVKRGVAPSMGLWAIPGGMLELGETLQEGAEREILEETGVIIRAGEPIYTFDFFEPGPQGGIRFHFVIVDLLGEYVSGEARGGDDAEEARWLAPEELSRLPVSKNTLALLKKTGFLPGK
ncbi:MAG: NUDIX hydrolase [Smithellaceae bacterium]|nr:NUDIX hydrolase [Smithellaceae bacterium]